MKLNNNYIYNSKHINAANKIATAFRKFKKHIDNKATNLFGFKQFTSKPNKLNNTIDYYLNIKTQKIVYMPSKKSKIEKKGTFKKIDYESNEMLSLKFIINKKWSYSQNEIAKIYYDLGIESFQPIYEVKEGVFISNNRGIPLDIILNNENKIIKLNDFKNILLDIKKLHQAGYYYRDFKPENITVDKLNKLWIIDPDSLARGDMGKIDEISTASFSTFYLLQEIYYNKNYNMLKTADDYALALTLLECNGRIFQPQIKEKYLHGILLTKKTLEWINKNVKPDYKNQFQCLIKDPVDYYNKFKANNHLIDMLIIK
ncbi:MAG TPA: hypothetical protein PKD00_10780 [Burkholderiales bacterium]|nr:hypothetical protein [Burkholderiales bacterium]